MLIIGPIKSTTYVRINGHDGQENSMDGYLLSAITPRIEIDWPEDKVWPFL
jgi:hypothetical protein